MKIAKLSIYYPAYVTQLFQRYPEIATLDYQKQLKAIHADFFAWADSWSHALNQVGHECVEIISNIEPLQRAWASENLSQEFSDSLPLLDITIEQIRKFRPDVLFVCDHTFYTRAWLSEVKEKCPSIQKIIGWCGAPYEDVEVFKAFDYVLSDTPELMESLSKLGHRVYHVNHGFDVRVLEHISQERSTQSIPEKTYPFTFAGSIARGKAHHLRREKLLIELAKRTDIEIFAGEPPPFKDLMTFPAKVGAYHTFQLYRKMGGSSDSLNAFPRLKKFFTKTEDPKLPLHPALFSRSHAALFGLDLYRLMKNTTVTLNCHIDVSPRTANNMRLYEATGVGTCLLTDWKENISDLFEPETEVVTYKSVGECIEKAKWLVTHPEEAKKIGLNAQKKTLSRHTWKSRAELFDEILMKTLARK